jgi:tetratricopeptide (TPR) repeat protein
MRFLVAIFVFFVVLLNANGQTTVDADAFFSKKDYASAADIYALLLEKKPADALLNYRMGRCCYELKNFENAIGYLEKSGTKYPLKDFYIADSYYLMYKFQEAMDYYNLYASGASINKNVQIDAYDKAKRCETALKLMTRIEDIEIIDSIPASKKDFLKFFRLSKESGKLSRQQMNVGLKGVTDVSSFITQRGDRKIYTDTVGTQLNLFQSDKLLDGWSKGVGISENINTGYDENYPFLMLDGLTLYFASNNLNSIGGYDIFITKYVPGSGEFLNPENIGMPFNSVYNDYMFVVDESNSTGWFVTDRYQPKDKVVIYHFNFKEEKEYFKSENDTILRQVAMLKISRKAEKSEEIQVETEESFPVTESRQLLFVVNDSVNYENTEQFRSQKALKLWYEKYRAENEYKEVEMKLNDLRNSFEIAIDDIVKKSLVSEIINLERKTLSYRLLLKEKEIGIRNEEINFLKNLN